MNQLTPIFAEEPPPSEATFTTQEILDQSTVTYRQIHFWVGNGWLHPHNLGKGQGFPWSWSADEIEVARKMADFVSSGLTPPAAHHAARNDGQLPGGSFRITEAA